MAKNLENRLLLRRAYVLACLLGHSCVGTEHLLIGAVMSPTPAWERQALGPKELLQSLLRLYGRGCSSPRLPYAFSDRAAKVLARGGELIPTLVSLEEGGAWRLLEDCHVNRDLLYADLTQADPVRKEQKMQMTRLLDQYTVDLAEIGDSSQVVIGREKEIETVLQILCRKHKNNPALIGEPGVGKTAIVEGVARCIAAGHVPPQLQGKRLLSLDMASLLAGTKYRGEFEERVRDVLNELRRVRNVILFVDEMHTLVGAGAAEGAIDAANLLKPPLGRGEIQMIGATTLEEYRKYIEKDAALARRFRTIQVREPTAEETIGILRGIREGLEAYHG
ncbi:MAG: ATP-dependent Clp protease ATP-binding subunit, partial [Oscillospiraceae bacterium]|nr:ATP-dependent Clp protease ATP-binding subunit [Oscillospiraceae bacterium]